MPSLPLTQRLHTQAAERPKIAAGTRALLLDAAALALSISVFLLLGLYQLELPGLYNDEAFDVIPAMQMVTGRPVEVLNNAGLRIGGLNLPLMSSSAYQGVTSTYLAVPFFALGGVGVISLRLMTVLVGALGVALTFFLARAWYGRPVARLAALLLAVSPAWVFWSRLGVYVVSEVVPLAAGALLALTAWVRRPRVPAGHRERNGYLYLAAFLMGLGLATKLLFLWFIVAAAIVGALLWWRPVLDRRAEWRGNLRRMAFAGAAAVGAFLAGAFPFVLYNAMTLGTLHVLRQNLTSTTHGVNNTAFLRNLWTEADAFKVLLDGGYFWFQGLAGRAHQNPLTPAIFAISAFGLLVVLLARSRESGVGSPEPVRFPTRRLLTPDSRPLSGLRGITAGCTALALALAFSVLTFAFPVWDGRLAATAAALAFSLAGTVLTAWSALRDRGSVKPAGLAFLVTGSLAGALWWFGGSGRPEGPDPASPLGLWPVDAAGVLFWLCGLGVAFVLGADPNPAPRQRVTVAALALIGLIVAQSSVTLSGLWSTHLLILLPLPQILIAAFAVELGRRAAARVRHLGESALRSALKTLPAVLLAGPLLLLDLGVDYAYHRDLQITGGFTTFSDAIYRLVDHLEEAAQPGVKVVAMDWGFSKPVQLLTRGEITPVEIYGQTPEVTESFRATLREFLRDPRTLYLFHLPGATAFHRRDAFFEEARAAGKEPVLERTFHHRDGSPIYEVYVVR